MFSAKRVIELHRYLGFVNVDAQAVVGERGTWGSSLDAISKPRLLNPKGSKYPIMRYFGFGDSNYGTSFG